MKVLYILLLLPILVFTTTDSNAQVTGLSGWNLFIDPGHSQNENVGVYGYSEAKKVLRVGLHLRDLFITKTDIDTVYMSRTNDQEQVSISQRYNYANSVAAAWFHSIHSDAGGPSANSVLLLISDNCASSTQHICNSRWGNITIDMANIISDVLSRGYQIPTRGVWGDRSFGLQMGTNYGASGVGVLRETNMPATLSEGGFHTNPVQNQKNMNEKWKRLEAYTLFWSILEDQGIQRPFVGITTGIISDIESALPINGAVVSLNGQADTTDTYESLFHLYSNDPDQLRNGFYFLEDLPAGTHQITVEAEGFDPYSGSVTIQDTFFTFKNIQMVSNVPPYITTIIPEQNDSIYPGVENIRIIFSRPMDKASVESTLQISPSVPVSFIWSDGDRRLAITTTNFGFNANYQLTISGNAVDKYGHPFDGDGNGVGGDDFILNFKTKVQDIIPPVLVSVYPPSNQTGVELKPILNLSFNEQVNTSTLSGKVKLIRNSDQSNISGILRHYLVNERSVANFFVTNELNVNENYTIIVEPGIKDIFGNEITTQFNSEFTTGNHQFVTVNNIDNFEAGIGKWWAPQQSGSTIGIITELTGITSATNIFNYILSGSKSMNLTYGWDTNASNWLIREYYTQTTPSFTSSYIIQTYLFGDGTGNQFRFAVRDATNTIEVSPWYTMDWIGWKLINWDMTNDGTGSWIGNGILDNPLRFDSYQLTYTPGNNNTGEVYFDDLRIVDKTTVGVEDDIFSGIPSVYNLEQNYPNPFNPSTKIKFSIPQSGYVNLEVFNMLGQKITTLINQELSPGFYSVDFSRNELSSGIYIYTLSVNDFVTSKKMILLK